MQRLTAESEQCQSSSGFSSLQLSVLIATAEKNLLCIDKLLKMVPVSPRLLYSRKDTHASFTIKEIPVPSCQTYIFSMYNEKFDKYFLSLLGELYLLDVEKIFSDYDPMIAAKKIWKIFFKFLLNTAQVFAFHCITSDIGGQLFIANSDDQIVEYIDGSFTCFSQKGKLAINR